MDEGTHDVPPPITWASTALRDVAAERRRQIEVEGWTPEHDDQHIAGSMAIAAACYAVPQLLTNLWPSTGWAMAWFKPKDDRSNLVRAAALLLAEIERLDRLHMDAPNAVVSGGARTDAEGTQ